jgi:hypothetical protein
MAKFMLFVLPLSVGLAILGHFAIARDLTDDWQRNPIVGFAIFFVSIALLGWFFLFNEGPQNPSPVVAILLVFSGALCILVALVLQFYLAYLSGENTRMVAELLAQKGGNVNLNVPLPGTVKPISYIAILAGICFTALGIRMASGKPKDLRYAAPADTFSPPAREHVPPRPPQTGVRPE